MKDKEYREKRKQLLDMIRSVAMPNIPEFAFMRQLYIDELSLLDENRKIQHKIEDK